MVRNGRKVDAERPKERALDRSTERIHNDGAILQKPRISVRLVESYSGLESCLPDHHRTFTETVRGTVSVR